jgi:hypothetical protein
MGNVSGLEPLLAASDIYLDSFPENNPEAAAAAIQAGLTVVKAEAGSVPRYVEEAARVLVRREADGD